ncbi:MAG: formylglycine-generating enzyme family protein [Planctomycetes bacterium]|nr:formylglycine-generating enzyme family protein [Planctomycetota bacterium]
MDFMTVRPTSLGGAALAAAAGFVGLWFAWQATQGTGVTDSRASHASRGADVAPAPTPDAALIERLRREAEQREVERRERSGPDIAGLVAVGKSPQGLYEYEKDLGNGVKLRLVLIPAGTFMMGSPESEQGRESGESPPHPVSVPSFLMGKYEVTQGEWQAVMGGNPAHFRHAGVDAPVERVNWDECRDFCDRIGLRLPTEAEWEYACRAGTTTAIYTGHLTIQGDMNGPELDNIAWYGGNSGVTYMGAWDSFPWREKQHERARGGTHPIGQKMPNAWGLYDTLGNVREWCEDALAERRIHLGYTVLTSRDGVAHVFRGGSWGDRARHVRAAYDGLYFEALWLHTLGFRVALSPARP